MIESISSSIVVCSIFILFLFGLLIQIKERNHDIRVKKVHSKRLLLGHKLSIWGFSGFLFFFPTHLLVNFGFLNNEVIFPGDTSYIATVIAFCSILIGKYMIHSAQDHSVKTLY